MRQDKNGEHDAAEGSYTLTVKFRREHGEDDEIAADAGRTLAAQLRAELQEAYDCGHIAGHFEIVSVREEKYHIRIRNPFKR